MDGWQLGGWADYLEFWVGLCGFAVHLLSIDLAEPEVAKLSNMMTGSVV